MRPDGSSYPERLSEAEFIAAVPAIRAFRHVLHGEVPPHWHEFYELTYAVSGEGTHTVNGVNQLIRRGNTWLLTPIDVHALRVQPPEPLVLINAIFSDEVLDNDLRALVLEGTGRGKNAMATSSSETADDFQRLHCEAEERRLGHHLATRATLERLLVDFTRHRISKQEMARTTSSSRSDLRRALRFIEHHFREPITLADAAAQAHLSPHYFSTRFHQLTGVPFQSYLQEARVRFAATLLQSTDLAVTDVCHASGFQTLSHFERAFKRLLGQTPSRYRTSQRQQRPSLIGGSS